MANSTKARMQARQTTAVFTLAGWDDAPTSIPALCDGRVDGLVVLAPRLEDDGESWLPQHTAMGVQLDNVRVNGKVVKAPT